MSEAILDKFTLPSGAGGAASEDVDAEWRGALVMALTKMGKSWHAVAGAPVPTYEFGLSCQISLGGATSARRALLDVLVLDRDEDGDVLVADALGVAFGVAPTFHDAATQWEEAAREHLEDLAAEEHRLHPRMREQLLFLRKIFG